MGRIISKPWDYDTLVPAIRALLKPREEPAASQPEPPGQERPDKVRP
jgi:hypothetical protein